MVTDAGPTDPDRDAPVIGEPAPGPEHRLRWPRSARVTTVVLAVLLTAALVSGALVVARLLDTNDQWQESSAQWEALAREHGDQAAQAMSESAQLQADLDQTTRELETAKERISELADELAKKGDAAATSQASTTDRAHLSQASDVAASWSRCVDGQRELVRDVEDHPGAVAAHRSTVQHVCTAASDADLALLRELGE